MSTNPFPPRCRERFRLDRLVARGGFGRVYRAYQIGLDRPVAVKILDASVLENEEDVARFKLEARITASLKHPHIVIVIDHDVEDGLPWIAYEFLPGMNLRDRLIEHQQLSVKTTLDVGIQVASALSEAHAHEIFHRDIKPDNIQEIEPDRYKVTDFGIAKWGTAGAIRTQAGIIVGTPAYLAPEQIRSQPVTAQTDLYSLGIVLYELLVGQPPFESDLPIHVLHQHLNEKPPSVREKRPDVPEDLDRVLARALEKNPADRHRGAIAMQKALEDVAERFSASGRELTPIRATPRQRELATVRVDRADRTLEYKPASRARGAGWAALAVGALALGLGGAFALRPHPDPSPSPTETPSAIAPPPLPASVTPPSHLVSPAGGPPPTLRPDLSPIERTAALTTADAMTALETRCTKALDALTESTGPAAATAKRDYAGVLQECTAHMESFLDAGVLADIQLRFAIVVDRLLAGEWARVADSEREALARRVVVWNRNKPDHWLPRTMFASLQLRDGDASGASDSRVMALGFLQTSIEESPSDPRAPALWKQLAEAAANAMAAAPDATARQHALALAHRAWVLKLDREGKLAVPLHREIEIAISNLLAPPPLKPEEARCAASAGDLEQRLAALHEKGPEGLAEAQKLARDRLEHVRSQLVERRGRALTPAVVDLLLAEAVETARALVRVHAPDPGRPPPARRPQDPPPPGGPELARTVADLEDLASLVLSAPIRGASALGPSAQDQFGEAAALLLRPPLQALDPAAFQQHQTQAAGWVKEYPEAWAAWIVDAARFRLAGNVAQELAALMHVLALLNYEYIAPPGGRPNPRAMRPWTSLEMAVLDCAHRKGDAALVEQLVVSYRTRAVALTKAGHLSDSASRKVEDVIARVYK